MGNHSKFIRPFRRILSFTTLCLAATGLSSCLFLSHSKIYNLGCEYEGVSVLERDTIYRIQGKEYIKGQRTRLRCCYDSWWFDPCRGVEYRPIEGTQEEIVYREVYTENGGMHTRGDWLKLAPANQQPKQVKVQLLYQPTHAPLTHGKTYTPWAILTTPAAVVSAVAVDIPMTVGLLLAVGITELIPGQQQQVSDFEKHSTTESQ